MLAFLVAIMFLCLDDSDWITKGIMIALLTLLSAVTVRMVLMDWGAIAPSSDTFFKRNKHIVISCVRKAFDLFEEARRRGFSGVVFWRNSSEVKYSRHSDQP